MAPVQSLPELTFLGAPMFFQDVHKYSLISALMLTSLNPAWAFDYFQALPDKPLIPEQNPLTSAKITLGKKLFFDKRLLGRESAISCNSCHRLKRGGNDGLNFSTGQHGEKTRRSSPGLWNIGIQTVYYWDGRSTSLEQQALDHLRDPVISSWPDIGSLITEISTSTEYQQGFAEAFPHELISGQNLAQAIASFERSLMAVNSPFDRYIKGEKSALSEKQQRGMQVFTDSGCLACHFGANFAGPAPGPALGLGDGFYELFPNNLGTDYEKIYRLTDDRGRFNFSGDPDEQYMWRVPPLRNIEYSAPYFHNGSVTSLHEAVRIMAKTQFNKELDETSIDDIVAFLISLSGETPKVLLAP